VAIYFDICDVHDVFSEVSFFGILLSLLYRLLAGLILWTQLAGSDFSAPSVDYTPYCPVGLHLSGASKM
jgi:hypothetical protein